MNCKKKFRALFQYRGSKDDVAHRIWERFGVDVNVYCEPFGGRLGCLLQRDVTGEISRNSVEVVGDINAKIVNVFRAIKHAPKELAAHLSNEVLAEIDVLARDKWLRDHRQELESLLLSHPESYWLEAAAWTIYQISLLPDTGVSRSARKKVMLSFSADIYAYDDKLGYLLALAERLTNVRLVYGSWERTVRACPGGKVTAVFFDPPYGWDSGRRMAMYDHDEPHVAKEAARCAVLLGRQPGFRVCFAGLDGEHQFPPDWSVLAWRATKARYENRSRERLWFSPGCLKPRQEDEGEAGCLAV